MSATNEQWSKLSFTGLETALRFAQVSFDGAERLVKLNLDISKQSLEENVKAVRELSGVSNPQEVFNRVSQIASQAFEQAVNNSRNVYEIISCTQAELTRLAEKNSDVINKTWATSIEDFAKNTPTGSDVAFDTLKNTIAATTALSNFNKVAEQVTVIADAGVKTASTEPTEAVKTAATATTVAVETAATTATEAVKTAAPEITEAVETAATETSEAMKVATTASTEAVKTAATETAKAAKITAKRSGS
ncbi:phasin family protein [Crenobacter sp. SG2305]|uniref:phasin family protein n=1 Tax=Crenobacter oryzisoli TaxID=3056844 RepID=UPI0025AAB072|nr:phasin family protein [Crenobacter sp. SG2305]MDN0084936.1 phasin family protein [Crenobacter sp. SG2305]